MHASEIAAALGRWNVEPADVGDGMPTIYVDGQHLVEVGRALRDEPDLRFAFMSDLFGVDYYPREPRYEVVYLLVCIGTGGFGTVPKRLRMKVRVSGAPDASRLPSVSEIWPAAGWAEREVYDFFGIHFDGHPDLRRILMPEDWEGFPMRKDYPVQIKEPVRLTHPLQVSEEQFVANIQAARDRAHRD